MSDQTYDEVKVRNQVALKTLDIPHAVMSAVASFRDDFRKIVGSEPIVEVMDDATYKIATYGAGIYDIVGQFSMVAFPGCCGIVVLYHASVARHYTSRGLGRLFLQLRTKAAVMAGYSKAIATAITSNKVENTLLLSEGWKPIDIFTNSRTTNIVQIYQREL